MADLKQLKQILQQKMNEESSEARDDCMRGDAMWETQAWLLRAKLHCTSEMNGYVESFKAELENANKLTGPKVAEKATLVLRTTVASCGDQFLGTVYKKEEEEDATTKKATTTIIPKCEEANVEGVDCAAQDATVKDGDMIVDKSLYLVPTSPSLPGLTPDDPETLKSLLDTESQEESEVSGREGIDPPSVRPCLDTKSSTKDEESLVLSTDSVKYDFLPKEAKAPIEEKPSLLAKHKETVLQRKADKIQKMLQKVEKTNIKDTNGSRMQRKPVYS